MRSLKIKQVSIVKSFFIPIKKNKASQKLASKFTKIF